MCVFPKELKFLCQYQSAHKAKKNVDYIGDYVVKNEFKTGHQEVHHTEDLTGNISLSNIKSIYADHHENLR